MRILWSLVVNVWLLVWWPLRYLRHRTAAPRGGFLVLKLDGPVVEIAPRPRFWARKRRVTSLHAVRRALELGGSDPRVRGLVVSFRELSLGAAVATSLRELLAAFRETGKPLVAFLPRGGGSRELYVASVADRVFLGHETWVLPLGYSVESPYIKHALEHLGVEPDVYARGEYKTAGEFLTASAMSPAQREQVGCLLDDSWERLVSALSSGRGVSAEQAEAWIHGAPYDAEEAARLGLVDGVLDDEELLLRLASDLAGEGPRAADQATPAEPAAGERAEPCPVVPLGDYARRRTLRFRALRRRPYIAVVEVHGAIVSKGSGALQLGVLAVDDDLRELLKQVEHDPKALGVVLHIDSRGGSALASDRILRGVKSVAAKKPVVAYLGNVAASGGYMIALGAEHIVAQPASVTGSIGVVALRMVFERLSARLGIDLQRVSRGAHADMLSPFKHFSASERARFESLLDAGYQRFVASVAGARKRPVDEIEPLARGRVWSAKAAAERGLVDALGGLELALESVRQKLGGRGAGLEPIALAPDRATSPLALLAGAELLAPLASAPGLLRLLRLASPGLAGNLAGRLAGGSPEPLLGQVELWPATRGNELWLWCDLDTRDAC